MNAHDALTLTDAVRLGAPAWMHALWIAPALALVLLLASARSRRLLKRFASPTMLASLAASVSPGRRRLKHALVVLAAALAALALARPQFGYEERTTTRRGRDVVFVVDVSRSMLAADLAPNRLERVKLWMKDLVAAAEGDRIGLVAFAGAPVVRSPLTQDRDFLLMAIDELSPDAAPRGGTNIGDAIRKTLDDVFSIDPEHPDEQAPYRDIILITDGDDQESFPVDAARTAGDEGVRIIALGVGSSGAGAPVPDAAGPGYAEYEGQTVRSALNPDSLAQIAAASDGGVFLNVGTGLVELDEVYRDLIHNAQQGDQGQATTRDYFERYAWVLLPAFVCLVAESLVGERRRRSP
ncbi:MAG: VWA domain-containing protein [Phycisphaerales bacterium]